MYSMLTLLSIMEHWIYLKVYIENIKKNSLQIVSSTKSKPEKLFSRIRLSFVLRNLRKMPFKHWKNMNPNL